MKRIFLFIAASLVFLAAGAQITQSASDSIALQRMSKETRQYTLFAQKNLQTDFTITTSEGEVVELDYPCWVYYINYIEETDNHVCRYLIVKESNGNLLEVKTKNNVSPNDLATWRIIKVIEIPVTDYSLGSMCNWNIDNLQHDSVYIINSQEVLLSLILCIGGSIPTAIDFNQYSLLFVHGGSPYLISSISKILQQLSLNTYQLNIEIYLKEGATAPRWETAFIVKKLNERSKIEVIVTFIE
jgi:hypothetical protein